MIILREETIKLTMSEFERGIMVNALNEFRSTLIVNEKPTEDVDSLLLKTIEPPARRRWELGYER